MVPHAGMMRRMTVRRLLRMPKDKTAELGRAISLSSSGLKWKTLSGGL